MNKIVATFFMTASLAISAFGGTAGYVKSLGIITGENGSKYIRVEHSVTAGTFGAGTAQLWGLFYVPWSEDDVQTTLKYAALAKSLENHSISIDATNGTTTNAIEPNGVWVPVVTNFNSRNP
jgi:hypothetical protein